MGSPFKTHETMDLARAMLEEDSECTNINCDETFGKENENGNDLDPIRFGALVVTKESSTELISSHHAESTAGSVTFHSRPPMMTMRDMNAGKGIVDDDGKPVVGKVFSRVIQVSGESKPKQLKPRRQQRKDEGCCSGSGSCCASGKQDTSHANHRQERGCSGCPCSGSARPQSSTTKRESKSANPTRTATVSNVCPQCNRQFSDETMKHHLIFCTGTSKEIM